MFLSFFLSVFNLLLLLLSILSFAYVCVCVVSRVLLERVPKHIDMDSIKGQVLSLPNVEDIHDIHIWSITAGACLGTAHVIVDVDTIVEGVAILEKVSAIFEKGKVHHVTLQVRL